MKSFNHLVSIHVDRCIGCTRCMRVCPTEAIRIVNKKVQLLNERCIYCGNCVLACHKSAYKIESDSFATLSNQKLNVALLPLAAYGMVSTDLDLQLIYQTLYNFGFDEVFDLSIISDLMAEKIEKLSKNNPNKTYIHSQCPSIIRLIQLKFPSLIDQIIPFDFPFEIGAKLARKYYSEKYQMDEDEIGISYITECLSNYIAIKDPIGNATNVDHVFLFSDLMKSMATKVDRKINVSSSKRGIVFSKVGAIEEATDIDEYICVDGINHVSEVLDKIYLNQSSKIKIIEAYSCIGGCVGGNFTLENTYVAKWKVNHYYHQLKLDCSKDYVNQYKGYLDEDSWYFNGKIESKDPYKLSENIWDSFVKMNKINEILKKLPNIDCCACGSPSCRALAEDIVLNKKTINDCMILNKKGE